MKIQFCGLCNESVPQACLDDGRAIAHGERVVCATCRSAFRAPAAARSIRKRDRSGQIGIVAILVSQVIVFVVYAAVVAVALFIVRQHWHWSVDGFLDQVIGTVS
jgi:hypothetical protein